MTASAPLPVVNAKPERPERPRRHITTGLKRGGRTLVMFALTASFALLSWASYAESTGAPPSQQQIAAPVHAPR